MKSKGPKGRRCPVCFQNFWLPSLAVEGTSLRKVTFPAKSLWDEAWVSVGLGSKVVSTPSSGFIKMTTHRPLCQNAGIHLKTPATNASCKVRDFCWGLRGSWLHDPLHGVEPGSIYMDTIFFLSFSSPGLLFFFKNPCKGYIFLCKHNFYFRAGKQPQSH